MKIKDLKQLKKGDVLWVFNCCAGVYRLQFEEVRYNCVFVKGKCKYSGKYRTWRNDAKKLYRTENEANEAKRKYDLRYAFEKIRNAKTEIEGCTAVIGERYRLIKKLNQEVKKLKKGELQCRS